MIRLQLCPEFNDIVWLLKVFLFCFAFLRSIASAEKVSSFFYVLHLQQGLSLGELTWYQVLTIQEQEQTVVNPLQFVEEGNYCIKVS